MAGALNDPLFAAVATTPQPPSLVTARSFEPRPARAAAAAPPVDASGAERNDVSRTD
jgi:hypothetical protein